MNEAGENEPKDDFFTPFEKFLDRYKTRPKSYKRYKYLLGPFFGWLKKNTDKDTTNFDAEDAEAYLEIANTLKRNSKKQLLTCLRRYINVYRKHMIPKDDTQAWQIHGARIERMKARDINIPADKDLLPQQMALSLEELDQLLEIASHKKEQFLLLYLYGYFGFRLGERRRIIRVNWDKTELEVRTEKTDVLRILYFNDITKRLLKEAYRLGLPQRSDSYIYGKFKELSGIFRGSNRRFSPNTMRHTFKTWMKNKVKDETVVNSLMGHTDKSVPGIYDHIFEGEKRRAMTELHYFNDLKFLKNAKLEA